MTRPKRKTEAQLQSQCDAWNEKHAEGVLVSYESVVGEGETHLGKSISPAEVLGGHSAVIWLEGKSGCVALDHCKVVEQERDQPKPLMVLVNEAFEGWDQEKASEPIVQIVEALATDGRFDEMTEVTTELLKGLSTIPHISGPLLKTAIVKKVCVKIFSLYVLKQPGVDPNVAMELWGSDIGASAIREFALKPGRLGHVVQAFVCKAQAESQKLKRT